MANFKIMFLTLIDQLERSGKVEEGYSELIKLKETSEITAELLECLFLIEVKLKLHTKAFNTATEILKITPNNSIAWANKANVLYELGDLNEALEFIDRAIEIDEKISTHHSNRSNILMGLGSYQDALKSCDAAIEIDANNKDGWMNKANALFAIGNFELAETNVKQAIEVSPQAPEPWLNLGRIFNAQNRDTEALICYEKALSLKTDFGQALINIGFTYARMGNTDLAVEFYEQAAELNPDLKAEVLWNIALIYLAIGRFKDGLKLYESRWKMKEFEPQKINSIKPRWDGTQSIKDKKILVYAEQGLGDSIQFCRYLEKVEALGAEVIFKVQKPLIASFKNLAGVRNLVALDDTNPTHDLHVPLLSLPGIFNTEVISIPRRDNYIKVQPHLIARWKEALRGDCYKIGINWQGRQGTQIDIGRSLSVNLFEKISHLPNVQLISLQKGYGSEQLQSLPQGMKVLELGDELDANGAFLDTAAVMKNLDLVISSDTAIAHLAGALGVKTWVALKFTPDWRWMLGRSDSPWYPSMTLYRQEVAGNWESVFEEIRQDLIKEIQNK